MMYVDKQRKELISKRLKEELDSSTISNYEIAKKVGVTNSLIAQYKTKGKLPSLVTLAKICEVIGSDANYILGITDNNF